MAAKKQPVKRKVGRPRIEIDYSLLEQMCKIHCTRDECAAVLKVSHDTMERALKRDLKTNFASFFKKYSAEGKSSLRRAQYKAALGGNVAMLIWLGKQQLGQRDNIDHNVNSQCHNSITITALDDNGKKLERV